jgi:hypothetical protein
MLPPSLTSKWVQRGCWFTQAAFKEGGSSGPCESERQHFLQLKTYALIITDLLFGTSFFHGKPWMWITIYSKLVD